MDVVTAIERALAVGRPQTSPYLNRRTTALILWVEAGPATSPLYCIHPSLEARPCTAVAHVVTALFPSRTFGVCLFLQLCTTHSAAVGDFVMRLVMGRPWVQEKAAMWSDWGSEPQCDQHGCRTGRKIWP